MSEVETTKNLILDMITSAAHNAVMQNVIVIIIVALAVGIALYRVVRLFRKKEISSCCGAGSTCAHCQKQD
ncbi:MAG: FeoB-associated Cys-rich membrane protein [Leptospirales bacterium]|nr:FeoB-associated Cys-rich membrane protein [Leptospirales bacterium]